jgi:polyisoprenoid-binding protein YceI
MANAAAPVQTPTTTWNIDPAHSIAEFKVKHMMIANVKGQFSKVSGALILDESDLANSRVEASIEAASIHTRDDQRKSADFFDIGNFPTLTFKSSRISIVKDGELSVEGELTIRGVTRNIRFAVQGPNSAYEGSLGQHPSCDLCDYKDQPKGLRPDLECCPRDWRNSRRRRGHHHPRCRVREGLRAC